MNQIEVMNLARERVAKKHPILAKNLDIIINKMLEKEAYVDQQELPLNTLIDTFKTVEGWGKTAQWLKAIQDRYVQEEAMSIQKSGLVVAGPDVN